ncbi:MAG: isoprenyl transferase [Eubacteriales bacterium]|nr:isoprenyl transferase [Eubacteriales bacterium]
MAAYDETKIRALGLNPQGIPKHVAIIMDGNGRWAKNRRLPRSAGHRAGTDRLRGIIRLSSDLGIASLTLYAFSTENWKRPSDEVGTLMGLLIEYFTNEIDELHENNVRIQIIGAYEGLPAGPRAAVERAMKRTEANTGLNLNIALNYGSRAELVRAVRVLSKKAVSGELLPQEIDEALLFDCLYTKGLPQLDLVIRTGGEMRLSNFMLLQAAYAELYFTDTYWPDFNEKKYIEALKEFQRRDRRYGTVK